MRAPAFVRRLIDRIGTALDPAENLLSDGLANGPVTVTQYRFLGWETDSATGQLIARIEVVSVDPPVDLRFTRSDRPVDEL